MTDRRLLACAQLCEKGGSSVDVGTDHGYLAVHLVQQGISKRVTACDINEAPLASARENVAKAGLSDSIDLVLSDGLDRVDCENVTNVIIAGMGGELIADIISRAAWLRERRVNLVLQPMTKWDHLRRYLAENGFSLKNELACIDGRFVYSVMQAVYTGETVQELPLEYLYGGLVTNDTEDGRAYLMRQAQRLEAVGRGIAHDLSRTEEAEKYLGAADILIRRANINETDV